MSTAPDPTALDSDFVPPADPNTADISDAGTNLRARAEHIQNAQAEVDAATEQGELEGELLADAFDFDTFMEGVNAEVDAETAAQEGAKKLWDARNGLSAEQQASIDAILEKHTTANPPAADPTPTPETPPAKEPDAPAPETETPPAPAEAPPPADPTPAQDPATPPADTPMGPEQVVQIFEKEKEKLTLELRAEYEGKIKAVEEKATAALEAKEEIKQHRDQLKQKVHMLEFERYGTKKYNLKEDLVEYAFKEVQKLAAAQPNKTIDQDAAFELLLVSHPSFFQTETAAPPAAATINPKPAAAGTGGSGGSTVSDDAAPAKKADTWDQARSNMQKIARQKSSGS